MKMPMPHWCILFYLSIFFVLHEVKSFSHDTCKDDNPNNYLPYILGCNACKNNFSVGNYAQVTLDCSHPPQSLVAALVETIQLYFFYGSGKNDREIAKISEASELMKGSHWKSSLPTAVFVPGWHATADDANSMDIVGGYAKNASFNLLVVDWTQISWRIYNDAVAMVAAAGRRVAAALNGGFGATQVVGHSLGAHMAGHLARSLEPRPALLAGLDPAGPLLCPTMSPCAQGMSSTDAEYVVVIHSDWNKLGCNMNLGVVDMLANDGYRVQPGCLPNDRDPENCNVTTCSHLRAQYFWSAAIGEPGSVVGRHCPTWDHFAAGACAGNPTLDVTTPTTTFGTYCFTTNAKKPFGRGIEGADA